MTYIDYFIWALINLVIGTGFCITWRRVRWYNFSLWVAAWCAILGAVMYYHS